MSNVREQMNRLYAKCEMLRQELQTTHDQMEAFRAACVHDWTRWEKEYDFNDHGQKSWMCARVCRACDKRERDLMWEKLQQEGKA